MNHFGYPEQEENMADVLSTEDPFYAVDNFCVEQPGFEDDVD